MRIYYLHSEYETGKHKIMKVWSEYVERAMPEDSSKTNINIPYTILEIDERYNRWLARQLLSNSRGTTPDGTQLPDKYYVNSSGQLCDEVGNVVTINPNPQKESYKLSQLYGMTQAQLETYIDNQMATISNITQAKTVIGALLRKMAAVELWLVKQSKLGE